MPSAPLNLRTLSLCVWPDISRPPRSSRRRRLQKRPLASKWRTSTSDATSCRGAGEGGGKEKKNVLDTIISFPKGQAFISTCRLLFISAPFSLIHACERQENKEITCRKLRGFFCSPHQLTHKNLHYNYFLLPHRISSVRCCLCFLNLLQLLFWILVSFP